MPSAALANDQLVSRGLLVSFEKLKVPLKIAALTFVFPHAVDVDPGFDRVFAMYPGHGIAQVEREIGAVLQEPVVEAHIGRIGDVERKARDDAVGIALRVPLPRRETNGGPEHRRQRVSGRRDAVG